MAAGSDPSDPTSIGTLTSPPQLPTLPFDLVAEILCRLPVKLLLQLRCLCKSFNSLISNPKFTKKHLRLSTPRRHLMVSSRNNLCDVFLFDSTIHYVLSTSRVMQTQIHFPASIKKSYGNPVPVCSCDDILCFTMPQGYVVLWNPSIRKFKMMPPLENQRNGFVFSVYSFGYDHFIHDYKIVAISFFKDNINEVSVYTPGMHFWRRIQDFPYSLYIVHTRRSGVFVSGTVNWFVSEASDSSLLDIVSLDLENESYQKLWQPCSTKNHCILGVLKDCLSIFASTDLFFYVWVMKEYGNIDSWTKLYNVSCRRDWPGYGLYKKTIYSYEDNQILIETGNNKLMFSLYDYKNGTLKFLENQNISCSMDPEIYIESLISPCF